MTTISIISWIQRERERERDRDRDRETDRQTDRQTDTHTHTLTHSLTRTHARTHARTHTHTHTHTHTDREGEEGGLSAVTSVRTTQVRSSGKTKMTKNQRRCPIFTGVWKVWNLFEMIQWRLREMCVKMLGLAQALSVRSKSEWMNNCWMDERMKGVWV